MIESPRYKYIKLILWAATTLIRLQLSASGCAKLQKVNVFIYLKLPATTVAGEYRVTNSLKMPAVKGKKYLI